MDYSKYDTFKFATDDSFIKWTRTSDAELHSFWENFIQENPHKKREIEKARRIILSIEIKGNEWPAEREAYIKNQVLDFIETNKTHLSKQPISKPSLWKKRKYWNLAAIFIGLLCLSVLAWDKIYNKPLHYQTEYGITEEFSLPDGSNVILNANSILTFHYSWWTNKRQVILEGEAFFSVKKTPDSSLFSVTSGDILTEVLGTEFSIRSRRANTRVILESGSIKLTAPTNKDNNNIYMHPGELVEFDKVQLIQKKDITVNQYDGLKEHMLVFNQTPLKEVALQVEDIYGVTLHFPANMNELSFTAKIPVNKEGLETLNTLLMESFALKIRKKVDSEYYFEKQKNKQRNSKSQGI